MSTELTGRLARLAPLQSLQQATLAERLTTQPAKMLTGLAERLTTRLLHVGITVPVPLDDSENHRIIRGADG